MPSRFSERRREAAIEAARRASAFLFHSRSAAAAVVDAVLAVADKYEIERLVHEAKERCS